ncbi:MAG: CHAT domain-containing protein [Acidobacteriota bacterium]
MKADLHGHKARALKNAALSMITNSRYRHPFYWAGFVSVGNNG